MYLASDAFGRKRTFFEEEQRLIASKVNHSDSIGEVITARNLMNLYDRQARQNSSTAPLPKMDTPKWDADIKLFERMADLMNQSYGNTPKTGQADFTVPKFIYLLGMGLLAADNPEKSIAYMEVANRYGIPAVKKVEEVVKSGVPLAEALTPYPVNLAPIVEQPVVAASVPVIEASQKTFTNEGLKPSRPAIPVPSYREKATQQNEAKTGLSVGV
jgi:hypothetical protein